jgi:hypothetical protein
MASRRIKPTINNKYVQPLKLGFKNKHIISLCNDYNSIMTKVSHKPISDSDYSIKAWLKFNAETFDGIQMFAGLMKNKQFKSIGSCTFKIYSISTDDNWVETLLVTSSGTALPDGRFKATATEAALSPAELIGEITFKMEVDITRANKNYSEVYFFNHIGIYGSFIQLKQDVDFLDITKLDE